MVKFKIYYTPHLGYVVKIKLLSLIIKMHQPHPTMFHQPKEQFRYIPLLNLILLLSQQTIHLPLQITILILFPIQPLILHLLLTLLLRMLVSHDQLLNSVRLYLNYHLTPHLYCIQQMWLVLTKRLNYLSSELGQKNAQFLNRVKSHQKKFNLHQKTMHIQPQNIDQWAAATPKKQLTDKIIRQSKYDFDVKEYIKKFNQEHQGKINLLDFSNYTTKFNDFKENPISQKDMEIIKEFQKRKIDQRLHKLKTQRYGKQTEDIGAEINPLDYHKDVEENMTAPDQDIEVAFHNEPAYKHIDITGKRWFNIDDDFIILILERNTSTKVTTLNRINFFRTVLFMGNGNGLISYGKSRDLTAEGSLTKAINDCKKNIIAIPLDQTCTMPRPINSKFQDYHVYLRPLPGFNSWGHPMFSMLLALSGIEHVGFKTCHTGKNNYTMLHSFFKAVTKNTTPQDMAELQGFKLYRHRFIRPLTQETTHNPLSY